MRVVCECIGDAVRVMRCGSGVLKGMLCEICVYSLVILYAY